MARRKDVEIFRQKQKIDNEPVWDPKKIPSRCDILKSLSWYHENKDEKHAAKFLGSSNLKLAKAYATLAWALRMQSRGCVFNAKELASIKASHEEFKKESSQSLKVVDKEPAPVASIQERVQNKTDYYIAELEGFVDLHGIHGKADDLDAYKWMQENGVKSIHAGRIAEYFREASKEPLTAVSGKDADLTEGYAGYSKKRILNLLKCYANIVRDAEKIAQNQKIARKPRKKKPVSFDKMVGKLNYLQKDDKLKLQSINPVKVVGVQQLWVYNNKTRKLGVYNAETPAGLSVKGSSIVGYAEGSSISKTVRKPEKVLTSVVDGGKVVLRKVLEGINSKPMKLNGRINKDTLLLRIV